ncbi:hypothetical protein M9H77_07593 [Catharanthus roseus]|uniref:Uncharacterized protein n=1 Tax=Catharanthus roseus TaxID=4058 RepID=A0ACC0BVE1_CATRO|nr:hypothetical protein M9H77_07593 [Catharanthus roseus]
MKVGACFGLVSSAKRIESITYCNPSLCFSPTSEIPTLNLEGGGEDSSSVHIVGEIERIRGVGIRKRQKGKIGITVVSQWYEPYSKTDEDRKAKDRALDFQLGW